MKNEPHLPECYYPLCDDKCLGYEDCWHDCICTALRACEARVVKDERKRAAERVAALPATPSRLGIPTLTVFDAVAAARGGDL